MNPLRWQCASCFSLVLLAGRVAGKPMCIRCLREHGFPRTDDVLTPAQVEMAWAGKGSGGRAA